MKKFLSEYGYDAVKMFLNQFATSILGFALVLTAGKAGSVVLRNVTSVFAILFYLFLLYTMTWDIGYREKLAVENGAKPRCVLRGVLISALANSINFLIAIFVMLGHLFPDAMGSVGGVATSAYVVLEGMYAGLLANHAGGAPLNTYWIMFFVITLPSMATCGISYWFGLRDKKFTKLFNPLFPESDREPKRKRKDGDE